MDHFLAVVAGIWKEIGLKVKQSVVFIDNPCAECLHWCGGPDILFKAGAIDIKEFSSFESGEENQARAVFIVSATLTGKTAKTIEDIVKLSNFEHCTVITAVNEKAQQYGEDMHESRENFFIEFEKELQNWMSGSSQNAQVLHYPLFIAPIASNLFLTPAFDNLYPIQDKDLNKLILQEGEKSPTDLRDLHLYMLPQEYKMLIRMLTSSFVDFFDLMNCRPEVFTLGHTSRLFSIQLSNLANQHKKGSKNQIGVLFIDRTLDLIGPSSHEENSLVDMLIGILPGLAGHCNNISVDMTKLCDAYSEDSNDDIIYPGCLVPPDEMNLGDDLLSDIINMERKEALKQIKHCLLRAISEEGLEVNKSEGGSNVGDEFEDLVLAFKENSGAILYNSGLLQLSFAVSQMYQDPEHDNWVTLAAKEKLMLQNMADQHAPGFISLITSLLNDKESCIPIEDIFSLVVYTFHGLRQSIENDDDLNDLSYAMSLLLSQTPHEDLPDFILNALDIEEESDSNKIISIEQFQKLVEKVLKDASELKCKDLEHFRPIILGNIEPPSYHPLMNQVISRIFHPEKPELKPDIEYISTGRKDLLNMGISMFRKITPPRPNDYGTLVIYVIGGITATEVGQVNRLMQKQGWTNCQIILGSNKLTYPPEIVDKTLFANNLHPDLQSLD